MDDKDLNKERSKRHALTCRQSPASRAAFRQWRLRQQWTCHSERDLVPSALFRSSVSPAQTGRCRGGHAGGKSHSGHQKGWSTHMHAAIELRGPSLSALPALANVGLHGGNGEVGTHQWMSPTFPLPRAC